VLILEDDAIFRTSMRSKENQQALVESMEKHDWDMAFLGHPLKSELDSQNEGIIQSSEEFKWAHCYAVSAKGLPGLVDYLETMRERPVGHPEGGKMYVDGAMSLYRRLNKNVVCLIHNPAISIQRGSPSGIADQPWYDRLMVISNLAVWARRVRDQFWRYTGLSGAK